MNGGSEILWTRFGQLGLLVEQAEDSGALGLDQINAILQNNIADGSISEMIEKGISE